MQLISDIINQLINEKDSLSSPFLKTKFLASKIKNLELAEWVNNELNGYGDNELPDYRIKICNVLGTFINGNVKYTNQTLPLLPELDKKINGLLYRMEFSVGISALESLAQSGVGKIIEVAFNAELIYLAEEEIIKNRNPYFSLISAKKTCPMGNVIQILSEIRNKLLDFMLKLDEEFGNVAEIEELKTKSTRIQQIMSQTIINTTGSGNVINTGENVNITADIKIGQGDLESLKKHLQKNGVEQNDIDELITILDSDKPDIQNNIFGNKVNTWVQKMLGKALNGTWQIAAGAAGGILVEIIKSYYGMK